jgi:hypothetical protein
VPREWAVVSPGHAQAGESLTDPVGSALKVRGHAARRALVWDFAFPSSSSSSCTRPLHSEFFHIRNSAAARAFGPPKTLLP